MKKDIHAFKNSTKVHARLIAVLRMLDYIKHKDNIHYFGSSMILLLNEHLSLLAVLHHSQPWRRAKVLIIVISIS